MSGQSYEEYVAQHIFAPLEMRNSFASQRAAMRHGMASGHRWWFGVPVAVSFPYNRAEPPPKSYGMGWESVWSNGRRLINHDGGTASFQSAMFFDPEARIGVYIAANVVNALDAFSSPHGSSPLDGSTARAMAQVVLSLATNHPLPDQGPGHERLTLIFDLVILALTVALVIWLWRTPRHFRRLTQRGAAHRSGLMRHTAVVVVTCLILPLAVADLAVAVAPWKVIAVFQPDLAYWVYAVAVVLFLRGLLEVRVAWGVMRPGVE